MLIRAIQLSLILVRHPATHCGLALETVQWPPRLREFSSPSLLFSIITIA